MDVRLSAYGGRVVQALGHPLDRLLDAALLVARGLACADLRERLRGKHGRGPGTKIFGGKVLAGDLAQLLVHVGRREPVRDAFIVDVLEELLAGQLLTALDDARDAAIADCERARLAGLAYEA
jgi:hypothetical protein